MSLEVISPGVLTTVQDLGRSGHRSIGVGTAGALDAFSHRVANGLVGNPASAATLEITLLGPRLRLEAPARIAICGAEIAAHCDGRALPGWRPIDVPAGSELRFGRCLSGSRAYLAVSGGIAVAPVLGSRATDLRAGLGGIGGGGGPGGDRLPLGGDEHHGISSLAIAPWWIDPKPDLDLARTPVLRVLPGRDATMPPDALCSEPWRVSAESDRQGLRLEGAPLELQQRREWISEPVVPGTVQLPANGQPIVLLGEAQTVGGYPRIAHVISADAPRLAQLRPGEHVHFLAVLPEQAHRLACDQRHRLARIELAVERQRHRPLRPL